MWNRLTNQKECNNRDVRSEVEEHDGGGMRQ